MPTHESNLQQHLLLKAPERLPDLRLFRRNVVAVQVGGRGIRAGIKGQSDLYGYVRGGRCIEVELKGLRGALRPEQKAWAAWCAEWGVPHVVLRAEKGETIDATVERWIGELRAVIAHVR